MDFALVHVAEGSLHQSVQDCIGNFTSISDSEKRWISRLISSVQYGIYTENLDSYLDSNFKLTVGFVPLISWEERREIGRFKFLCKDFIDFPYDNVEFLV